jgi:hypothetical protein
MNFINFGELFGAYVFVIDREVFWPLAVGYAALTASVPYLANRPQPTPDPAAWAAGSGRGKRARR